MRCEGCCVAFLLAPAACMPLGYVECICWYCTCDLCCLWRIVCMVGTIQFVLCGNCMMFVDNCMICMCMLSYDVYGMFCLHDICMMFMNDRIVCMLIIVMCTVTISCVR